MTIAKLGNLGELVSGIAVLGCWSPSAFGCVLLGASRHDRRIGSGVFTFRNTGVNILSISASARKGSTRLLVPLTGGRSTEFMSAPPRIAERARLALGRSPLPRLRRKRRLAW